MTTERLAPPLLAVKHTVPPARPRAVERARLEEQLRIRSRLTLVSAPAGWGKTSLLTRWAADPGGDVHIAWVSLEESDNDPVRFWAYVMTALNDVGAAAAATLEAVGAPATEPIDLALPMLLNDLADSPGRYVLVLDDYHTLSDARIHESVEYRVGYLPPSLRIVVAGRADPPFPLARLRARGDLVEVRADDLRFTPDEAADLVHTVAGPDLDRLDIEAVWSRTEGWAAGLQLVGLAARGGVADGSSNRHILDYLAAEVLHGLDPRSRDLLVATAPFERISGALCDAVMDMTGSSQVLDELDRADLFVTSVDAGREWYRCHPLLRDALERETLPSPTRDEVLERAADWYAGQGRLDEAVRHRLLAWQGASAAATLEAESSWFLDNGLATTFLALGERLPKKAVSPQLALMLAFAARPGSGDGRIEHWLDLAQSGDGQGRAVLGWRDARAAVLTLRALSTSETNPERALGLMEQAVALESEASGASPASLAALASAHARSGDYATAAPLLMESWRQHEHTGWPVGLSLQIAGLLGLSLLALDQADEVERLLRQAVPFADALERDWGAASVPLLAALRVVQGRHTFLRGDVELARNLLRRATTNADADPRLLTVVASLVFLADAELACGDRVAAKAALARAREFVDDTAPTTAVADQWLEPAEQRIGRSSVRAAKRGGLLVEPLTDREMSILRVMQGSVSQREIAATLHLSINTVKAYSKSLYRKLEVGSRADAVSVARDLGLI
jgi:LuxR family maltose regulon positive regulatory protein